MSVLPWKRRPSKQISLAANFAGAEPHVRDIALACVAGTYSVVDLPTGVCFDAEGLTFKGINFVREVQLCSLRLPFAINFIDCTFHSVFDARWLRADALSLKNSVLFAPFKGLSLTLDGHLDFEGVTSESWIDISVAEVGGDVKFARAKLSYGDYSSEHHPQEHPRYGAAIFAGGLQAHSVLMDGLTCHGRVFLDAARLSGILKATGASLESFYSHHAETGLHRNGKTASATKALNQWDHLAVSATDCTITGAVIFGREARGQAPRDAGETFVAYGQINLSNSQLMGDLVFTGAKLHSAYWCAAREVITDVLKQDELPLASLHASRALIDGAVFFDGNFESKGEVRLNSVDVRGIVRCEHSTMDGRLPNANNTSHSARNGLPLIAKAMSLVRAQIGNDFLLGPGFSAEGSVDFRNATIRGDLNCSGGRLVGWRTTTESPDDTQPETLAGSGAEVQGDLLLGGKQGGVNASDPRFYSFGQVRLRGTKVHGNFHLEYARLDVCENALGAPATSDNTSQLPFVARFESLNVSGATFLANTESREQRRGSNADPIAHVEFHGSASFEGMTTTVWEDSEDAWPQRDKKLIGRAFFELNGLTYQRLSGPLSGTKRLIWLLHQPNRDLIRPERKNDENPENTRDWGFKTQPWEQCASVLYQMGYRRDARFLYRQQQRFSRVHGGFNLIEKWYNALLGFLVGHGYRPYYALFWAFSLWALGWAFFDFAYRHHQIEARKVEVDVQLAHDPKFNPALFSLDVLLAPISLGEQERWVLIDKVAEPPTRKSNELSLGSTLSPELIQTNLSKVLACNTTSCDWQAGIRIIVVAILVVVLIPWAVIGAWKEVSPSFIAGKFRANSAAWKQVYRRALRLSRSKLQKETYIPTWRPPLGLAVVTTILLTVLFVAIIAVWAIDQGIFDDGLRAVDKYFFDALLKLTFVRFWITWQTLWGWLLVSALIVGVGGTVFRPRDLVR